MSIFQRVESSITKVFHALGLRPTSTSLVEYFSILVCKRFYNMVEHLYWAELFSLSILCDMVDEAKDVF